jgi:hypothetical protein
MIIALVVVAAGMGTTAAPSTTAIMSAMPLGKAGVGSAVNDTTRELGGALGVAVLGSIMASQYASNLAPIAAGLPGAAGDVAMSSLGGALSVSQEIGGSVGVALADAAKVAYLDGMGLAILTGVGVAVAAAALVYRYMPAEAAMPGEAGTTTEPGKDGYIPVGTEPVRQES